MISRSLSSEERSPPLASGWWRFTSDLNRALASSGVASASRPSASSALRSALRTVRASGDLAHAACRPSAELLEHAEGILGAAEFGTKARRMGARRRPPAVHAHLPGRAMPDDGFPLIAGDVVGAHAGEEIVGVIVLAHVIKAEPPIFLLAQTPLRRAMGRGRLCSSAIRRPGFGRAADDPCRA